MPRAETETTLDPADYRAEISLLSRTTPLNNCSQAPQSARTRRGADRYLEIWAETGMDWEAWIGEVEAARAEFAALVGGRPQDVAVGSSVSQLVSSLAGGLDFDGPRNRVVICDGEFPTVQHVWRAQRRRGAVIDSLPVTTGRISPHNYVEAIDDRTAVVSVSHGLYESGCVVEPSEIAAAARGVGAITVLDAYQTMGTRPVTVDATGVDVITSGCLKYLMGIPGLAFMWIAPTLAERLAPLATGWFGRREPFAFDGALDWADGARRLDLGTPPIFEAYVVREGLAWIREVGPERIQAWTETLSTRLMERARADGIAIHGPDKATERTPSTALLLEDAADLEAALRARGFLVSARGPVLRIAPHFYSTREDVDRVMDALQDVIADRS